MRYMKFGSQHITVLVIGVEASYHGMLCVCLIFPLIFYYPKFGGAYLYHFSSKLNNLKTYGCTNGLHFTFKLQIKWRALE
jgi:hypothetical protein